MKYPSFVAARYLSRRITAYVAITAVTLAVMVLGVVISVMDGFQNQIRENIRGVLSALTVQNSNDAFGLEERILAAQIPEIEAVSPRLQGYVLLDGGEKRNNALQFAVMIGTDAGKEAKTTAFKDYLLDLTDQARRMTDNPPSAEVITFCEKVAAFKRGEVSTPFPTHGSDGNEARYPGIIIGTIMQRDLGLSIGSVIHLVTIPKAQQQSRERGRLKPKAVKFVVCGLYATNEYEFAGKHIFMDLRDAEEYLEAYTPSEILIKLNDYKNAKKVQTELRSAMLRQDPDHFYYVATWEDLRRNLLDAIEVERSIMIVLLFFVFVVAGFMIWAVLYGMVQEKIKDIGILRAMGATRSGILAMYLCCGLFIGMMGSIVGTGLAVLVADNLNGIDQFSKEHFGWQIFPEDVYGFEEIPVSIDPQWLAIVASMAFGCALLSALQPAWSASLLTPVEAIRHE